MLKTSNLIYTQTKGKDYSDVIDHLSAIMRELAEASNRGPQGLHDIDCLLRDANPARMGVETIIVLLRYNFSVRGTLPHWQDFRDRAAAVLVNLGKNPQKIFTGLYR